MEKRGQPSVEVVRPVVPGMQSSGLEGPSCWSGGVSWQLQRGKASFLFYKRKSWVAVQGDILQSLAQMGTACLYRWTWSYRWSRSRLGWWAGCTLVLRAQSWERLTDSCRVEVFPL